MSNSQLAYCSVRNREPAKRIHTRRQLSFGSDMVESWEMLCAAHTPRSHAHIIGVCLALVLSSAATAHAHGGPAAVLGIASADGEIPNMVVLSEGLAIAGRNGWEFLCPRLWGDGESGPGKVPLALSVDGSSSWIIGTDDVYLARDGELNAQGREDLSSASVIALAADDDAVFGLRISGDGSAVVQINAQPAASVLFASEESWAALAVDDGRLHLARSTNANELALLSLDRQGEVVDGFVVPLSSALARLQLRPSGQRLFGVMFDGTQYLLGVLEDARFAILIASGGPIAGPQLSAGGALWIALDGVLMRARDAQDPSLGFQAVGEERHVTCLGRWRSLRYACVGTDIYELGDVGLQARIFQLDALAAPAPELATEAVAAECEIPWSLFRYDLERTGLSPGDWMWPSFADAPIEDGGSPAVSEGGPSSSPSSRRARGCSAAPSSALSLWASILVVAFLRRAASTLPAAGRGLRARR